MRDEFRKEAALLYKQMPYESNELYKKYQLLFELPDREVKRPDSESWKQKVKELADRLNLKFDIVVHNGIVVHSLSKNALRQLDIEAMDDKSITEVLRSRDKFAAYAYAKSEVAIELDSDADCVVDILFLNTSESLPVLFNIRARDGARVTVNELFFADADKDTVCGCMHDITAASGSEIELTMLHLEDKDSDVFTIINGRAEERSSIRTNLISMGGRKVRHRSKIVAAGKESRIFTNDVVLGFDSQKVDIETDTTSKNVHTESISNTRAIMLGSAAGIIKSFAKIEKGSKGSVSKINEHGIVDGEDSYIYLIPDMSIDESDVVATHAGAAAPIDKEKIFYMQSRGVDERLAKLLVMTGFLSESLGRISSEWVKRITYSSIVDKVKGGGFGVPEKIDISDAWISEKGTL